MNSEWNNREIRMQKKKRDILILGAIAFVLILATWWVFSKENNTSSTSVVTTMSENERKVCHILQQIDGVGDVSVMICETEDGVQSVVVVCDGAKNLKVLMNVREAAAAAVGASEKSIKIYLKKE